MDKHDLDVRMTVAEARLERATKRLNYLRDSALYGYQDDVANRAALYDYHAAQCQLLAVHAATAPASRAA